MVRVRSVSPSTSLATNSLFAGEAWAGRLTFGFARDVPAGRDAATVGSVPPGEPLKAAVRAALGDVEAFTRLAVDEANGGTADLLVVAADTLRLGHAGGTTDIPLGAYTFSPGKDPLAGDMFFGPAITGDLTAGSYGFHAVLHEVGHALGLKHPHEPGRFGPLAPAVDGPETSVMSARTAPGAALADGLGIERGGYAHTYMPADIAALQHLYGANYADDRNTRYVFDPREHVMLETVWDGGGIDIYDFARYGDDLSIDLGPGRFSTTGQEPQLNRAQEIARGDDPIYAAGSVHNAWLFKGSLDSIIENARGGFGDDTIRGNQLANHLTGGMGADCLFGGAQDDTLGGGRGDDRLGGGVGRDSLAGGPGADLLRGGTGADRLGGGLGADRGFGGAGDDAIQLGRGADRLSGGAGHDRLEGQDGDDWLSGDEGADRLFGGRGNDVLLGGAGDDTLDGGGATREGDRLTGGGGADVFVLSDTAKVVDFDRSEGDVLDVPDPLSAFASLTQIAGDAAIALDAGVTVLLLDTDAGTLHLADFL